MRKNKIIEICGLVLALFALTVDAATVVKTITKTTTKSTEITDAVYTEDNLSISLTPKNTQFTIKLKSNPTTGYSWFLRGYDKNLIQPVKHNFVAPESNSKLMGAPGYELWVFKMKPDAFTVPQQGVIRFVYARPWNADEGKQVVFRVSTSAR